MSAAYAADRERFDKALAPFILTGRDADGTTFTYLSPETPEPLAHAYKTLMAYGYATGLN